jgi:hypothetical protein
MSPARRCLLRQCAGLLSVPAFTALSSIPLAACALQRPPAGMTSGWLAEVEIIDRDTGRALPIYTWRGERYVAGEPGRRYAIALRNRTIHRVLAVIAVDGVNVVTGETASWDQNGYVFAGEQRWEVRGWRKSQERIAAFEFTRLADSYAARTGRPDHVGVIGVALFREMPPPVPPAPALSQRKAEGALADNANGAARAQAPAAAASGAAADAQARELRESERLGTGHGASESSWVGTTQFRRWQARPDELITIRYDSRQNLMALGVIPAPLPQPLPQPNPFPAALGFVPDPPPR